MLVWWWLFLVLQGIHMWQKNSQGLHVWSKLLPKEWYITFTFLGQFVALIIASHPPPHIKRGKKTALFFQASFL